MALNGEALVSKLRSLECLGKDLSFGLGLVRKVGRSEQERQPEIHPVIGCRDIYGRASHPTSGGLTVPLRRC